VRKQTPVLIVVSVAVVAAIGVAVAGFIAWQERRIWTNDAQIEAFGTDLSSNVTEEVVALFVDEGDVVVEGQLIALLRSDVPRAKKVEAEVNIVKMEQQILAAEAERNKVRDDFLRALEGIEDAVISAQAFDHAEKNLEIANAELSLAQASLELAVKQLDVIETELTHYEIRASQNGTIAQRWVWVGDVVTPGQSLFTMYDLEDVWVLARMEETKIESVRLGDEVKIHIDAYPGYTFRGEVFTIKGAAASTFSLVPQNNATGNYTKVEQRIPIKISIRRPDDFPEDQPLYLFPGMSAEVLIE
jgi:membrane fusion protein, multidrug efflux system